jgi:RNA polymerase sigma-70 factor (ECF subfamily)
VRRHQKAIFNLVYRLLGNYDEAAEVSQDVFLSAFKSIHQFRGEANFSTWLYRIGLNHASTRRKSLNSAQRRQLSLDGTEVIANSTVDPAKNFEDKEIQQRVQQALNSLDAEDARIILLRDLQDIPYDEVAEILDLPVGTVKSRLHRARQALKTSLAPYFQASRKAS